MGMDLFFKKVKEVANAHMNMVMKNANASVLDEKTQELAYIAVLASVGLTGGLPFHVQHAKQLGASRDEVKSAILVGLPAVGMKVIEAFEFALAAYD